MCRQLVVLLTSVIRYLLKISVKYQNTPLVVKCQHVFDTNTQKKCRLMADGAFNMSITTYMLYLQKILHLKSTL